MKFQSLASGSKGNCSIVISDNTKIIIDLGISHLQLKRKLEKNKLKVDDFAAILITHCHNDHIKGLSSTLKHNKINVYAPVDMIKELSELIPKERIVAIPVEYNIGDFDINYIKTSHDADYSVGYILTCNNKSIVYVTDTGYINRKYFKRIKGKEIYLIESNHDEEMLMNGPYPYYLKQRVISDKGHLSNETTAKYLKELVGDKTKYVFLAHLSEKNNTPTLAMAATEQKLKEINKDDIEIIIANQEEESPFVEV